MSFNVLDQGFIPDDSYSRKLDRRVAMDEYPYGYEAMEPGAGLVNQGLINDRYENDPIKNQELPWQYNRGAKTPLVPRTNSELGKFSDSEVRGAYQAKGRLKGN